MRSEVEEYVNSVPEERRAMVRGIIETIERNVPQAEVVIKHKMPTFQVGDDWIAVANQKNYVSIYTCSNDKTAAFRDKYPKIKAGTGCINIKDTDDFDLQDLRAVANAVFQ